MDCMKAFHNVVGGVEHCSIPTPLLGAARKWEPKVDLVVGVGAPTVCMEDEISRFSHTRNFSNFDSVTVNMWVVTSFVIEFFFIERK